MGVSQVNLLFPIFLFCKLCFLPAFFLFPEEFEEEELEEFEGEEVMVRLFLGEKNKFRGLFLFVQEGLASLKGEEVIILVSEFVSR
jgi:hypothetical protein